MIRLGIGIPCYGFKLDVGHAAMWLGVGAALASAQDKFELTFMSEYHINGIDLARNTIVFDALRAGCDWVLMVDADTFHRSTGEGGQAEAAGDAGVDLLQMIRDADRYDTSQWKPHIEFNGVGLVGAPVRGRGVGNVGVCVHDLAITKAEDSQLWAANPNPMPLNALIGEVRPVGRIGGACIAVNCTWLRQHWAQAPWFEMVHDYTERPRNARGEDYSICDGIYHRGGLVLCDGRFVPEHVDRRKLVGEP